MFTTKLEEGKKLLEEGKFQSALLCFQAANKDQPNHVDTLCKIGFCYTCLRKYEKAIDYFLLANKIRPDHADTLCKISFCYICLRKYEKALEYLLQANKIRPDHAGTLLNIGVCYEHLGEYKKALEYYSQANKIRPDHADTLCKIGICYNNLKNHGEGLKYFSQANKIRPDHAGTLCNIGTCYIFLGKHEKALEYLLQANKIRPDHAGILCNIGVCYTCLGEYEKALEYLLQENKIRPDHAGTLFNIGVCYEHLGEYKKALEYYSQANKIRPDHADTLCKIGVCYTHLGEYEEALDCGNKQLFLISPENEKKYKKREQISKFTCEMYEKIKPIKTPDKLLEDIITIYEIKGVKAAIQKAQEYEKQYPKPPQLFLVQLGNKLLKNPLYVKDVVRIFEKSSLQLIDFLKLGESILCIENFKNLDTKKRYWLALRCFCKAGAVEGAQRARNVCFKGLVYGDQLGEFMSHRSDRDLIGPEVNFKTAEGIIKTIREQHQKNKKLQVRNEQLEKKLAFFAQQGNRGKTFFTVPQRQERETQTPECIRNSK